jgi:hypothetical protein
MAHCADSQEKAEDRLEGLDGWRVLRLDTAFFESDSAAAEDGCFFRSLTSAVAKAIFGGNQTLAHDELGMEVSSKPSAVECDEMGGCWSRGGGEWAYAVTPPFVYLDGDMRNTNFYVQKGVERWVHKAGRSTTPFPGYVRKPEDYLQFWLALADQWQLREEAENRSTVDPIRFRLLAELEQYYKRLTEQPQSGQVLGLPTFMVQYLGVQQHLGPLYSV